jgi:protein-L-isoaspartate O-methyltransferase
MYRHAMLTDDTDVLDVGTGSGYGTALLCKRLRDRRVTSIDVDEYLTKAAAERLDSAGLHPQVTACDATGPRPGAYDRIVSTVAVRPVPASWLTALRPGGRLVTTITGTTLILTADKTEAQPGKPNGTAPGSCPPAPAPPTPPQR